MEKYGQLILYKKNNGKKDIEVKLYDETVWLNQNQLVDLFESSKANISEHINHIFQEGELIEKEVTAVFPTLTGNGKTYNVKYYNLDMILAIGYRVRTDIGTTFRQWATETLKEYVVKGFALNDKLLKNAGGGTYFKELLARIRDIRTSEKVFWRQILDIYATSIDYNPNAESSIAFFKQVQNKMHWAAHKHTAAEIIYQRADSKKQNMGLTSWAGKEIKKTDVEIAKNYLSDTELDALNKIVTAYLDIAEVRALDHEPMYMKDWLETIDDYLKMTRREILTTAGRVSHKQALDKAHDEYKKYKAKEVDRLSLVEKHFLENIRKLENKVENK